MANSISPALRQRRYERDYVAFAALFAVLMVLTNIIGTKLFLLFPQLLPTGLGPITQGGFVVLTTGLITYPLTFLCTDVVAEIWGRRRAQYLVLLGFASSLLMLLVIQVAVALPRADRFWADASGQYINGTQLLAAATAGEQRLLVDDAGGLDTDPQHSASGEALLVALHGSQSQLLTATGFAPEDGRWDQRGAVLLAGPLPADLPRGTWVVPGLRVAALSPGDAPEDDLRLQVDRPALLGAQGRLRLGDGGEISFRQRSDDGWLVVQEDGFADQLQPGTVLAVVDQYDPPRLQMAYQAVFAAPGILLIASMCAYLVAQFLDVTMFHFWRRLTKGRYLWLRNNASTWVSQLADSILVNGIFLPLAFGMSLGQTAMVIVAVYVVKLGIAALDTPLIYAVVWYEKRRLGYDFRDEVPDLLAHETEEKTG